MQVAVVEVLEDRTLLSGVMWTGNAGDNQWTTPSNWSTGSLPGSGDSVVINASAGTTIQIASTTVSVQSITTNASLQVNTGATLAANTIQASANVVMAGGTLLGGTVTGTGGAELVLTSAGGTLDGVTIGAGTVVDGTQAPDANATIVDGLTLDGTVNLGAQLPNYGALTFSGTQELNGTGTILFINSFNDRNALNLQDAYDAASDSYLPATLTISTGITIAGGSGNINFDTDASLVNDGTIDANTPGGTITVFPDTGIFTNDGVLEASGGGSLNAAPTGDAGALTLSGTGGRTGAHRRLHARAGRRCYGGDHPRALNGAWTNEGTISATDSTLSLGDQTPTSTNAWSNAGTVDTNDSTINLGGQFTLADLGAFSYGGSTVNLTGTLENMGTTLSLSAATGSWFLDGGIIEAGTISATGQRCAGAYELGSNARRRDRRSRDCGRWN